MPHENTADRTKQEADDGTSVVPPQIERTNANPAQNSLQHRLQRWWEKKLDWSHIFQAVGIIVGLLVAWIYLEQLNEMSQQTRLANEQANRAVIESAGNAASANRQLALVQDQLKAMRDQAMAARDSVAAVQKQMFVDQRPWVGVTSPIVVSSIKRDRERMVFEYAVSIKNFGKSPALRVLASAGVVFDSKDVKRNQDFECGSSIQLADAKIFEYIDREGHNVSIDDANLRKIPPYLREKWGIRNLKPIEKHGTTLFPGEVSTQPITFSGEVKQETSATTYFPGCIIYRDQFSNSIIHETRFCQETSGALAAYVIGTPLVNCSIRNTAD